MTTETRTQHTPGLLYTSEGSDSIRSDNTGQRVAQADKLADRIRLADCWNFCAGINPEAVPDLLAACRMTLDFLETQDSPGVITQICTEKLRAALAKAEARP